MLAKSCDFWNTCRYLLFIPLHLDRTKLNFKVCEFFYGMRIDVCLLHMCLSGIFLIWPESLHRFAPPRASHVISASSRAAPMIYLWGGSGHHRLSLGSLHPTLSTSVDLVNLVVFLAFPFSEPLWNLDFTSILSPTVECTREVCNPYSYLALNIFLQLPIC